MSSDIIVQSAQVPGSVLVINGEHLAALKALTASVTAAVPQTAGELEAANLQFKSADALLKKVHDARLELTRPIDEFLTLVIAKEKEILAPLKAARDSLAPRLVACRQKLVREQQEEEKRIRETAEAAVREAQRKLDEEAAAVRRKAEEDRLAEERLFGLPAAPAPAPVEEPTRIVVPVVAAVPVKSAPIPKAAARVTVRHELVISPEAARWIFQEACKDGGKIAGVQVLSINADAVEGLVKGGVPMGGAVMAPKTGYGANK